MYFWVSHFSGWDSNSWGTVPEWGHTKCSHSHVTRLPSCIRTVKVACVQCGDFVQCFNIFHADELVYSRHWLLNNKCLSIQLFYNTTHHAMTSNIYGIVCVFFLIHVFNDLLLLQMDLRLLLLAVAAVLSGSWAQPGKNAPPNLFPLLFSFVLNIC